MRLEKIALENFRCFKRLEVTFDDYTTILVANNGQGKSTILDAIRIILWPFISQFDLAKTAYSDPANTITIGDVRTIKTSDSQSNVLDDMARQFPSSITAFGKYNKSQIIWQRFRDSEAKKSQTKDDVECKKLKELAKRTQQQIRQIEDTPINLPVFGYYGIGRLWREKRLTDRKKGSVEKNSQQIRTFAYYDCLDPASSYRQFEDWFTDAYKKLLENQINQLQQGATSIEDDPKLKTPIKVVQDAVNEVLKSVGWKDLKFSQRDNESLVLQHDELGLMRVDRLSDGIKNMLAMVADIAYRAVLLNGHFGENAAKKSSGIVMIDEIDMHLHPQWQQTVVNSLRNAFPNIQFIITTHSPQVLSTVPKECIRILEFNKDSDDMAAIPLATSYGLPSNDILQAIMNVDPQPPVPEKEQLEKLTSLIEQGQYESSKTIQLLKELKEKLSDGHPQILKIERSIRRQKALRR